ncbi:MAG TPA: hypothetical protein VNT79_15175 [Phycisphaerae bacterium]|nr:hypothetical protein [Phycisphaerae bacterium]
MISTLVSKWHRFPTGEGCSRFPTCRKLSPPAILILLFLSIPGCGLNELKNEDRLERGLVVVLPGVEGPSPWNRNIARGLDRGGVNCGIEVYDWGTKIPGGFLINLTSHTRNERMAKKVSRHLQRYMCKYPDRQVHVVGHSGGAAIALMAVGQLPKDCPVESVTLLGVALSPAYDLRPALARTRSHIYNCYSQRDCLLLGPGTRIAGTIDRQYCEAAGKVGFELPEDMTESDSRLYAKLRQREWHEDLLRLGNDGGHAGWTHPRFVQHWIAPAIRNMLWDAPEPEIACH